MSLGFGIDAEAEDSRARAASFETLHGPVTTPVFMPVGTQGTVRGQTPESLETVGSQVLLANAFHLIRRPGLEVFERMGGIHRWMGWPGPVLTDSGGYQVFSLGARISDEGALLVDPIDGRPLLLTPESSIRAQRTIGSDIMMAMDQCVPGDCAHADAEAAVSLTTRWARRSLTARGDSRQALFGIIQGACHPDLRARSAEEICALPFDGFAIGGLAVGETRSEREDVTAQVTELLPRDRPRYLMGVGTPLDLLEAVHRGVDLFDCILPTAYAQQGVAFTSRGRVDLRRGAYRFAEDALDPACDCPACSRHSRAYLHHLVKAREPLVWERVGRHNLLFYHRLMTRLRSAILDGTFARLYAELRPVLGQSDPENPKSPPRPKRRPSRSLELGAYAVRPNPSGSHSIVHLASGEAMHSVNDPETEARSLYCEQTRLAERLGEDRAEPLILWDVGLGAATNAMAAIQLREQLARGRALRVISFETDLDSLRLAFRQRILFPWLRHAAPKALLTAGAWRSTDGSIEWRLVAGDFFETMASEGPPDLIFYDPFSAKANPALWERAVFERLRQRLGDHACQLFTYSASTRVRAKLLSAGFSVARGQGTGPKQETTIAITGPTAGYSLLGAEWLGRWDRSRAFDRALDPAIRAHPQFSG